MRKCGNNKQYKLSKLFSLFLILVIATTDVAPLVSVAVDTINEDKETVEEITGEEQEIEEEELEGEEELVEELELEEYQEIEEEEGLQEEELELVEPQQEIMGISMMSMSTQSTPTYVMATDADFSGTSNGNFRYIGKGEYVEIPHVIEGINVTSYSNMFRDTSVKGVKSTNKNVTNMSYMFYESKTTTLEVTQLDTSNVVNMSHMFASSNVSITDLTDVIGLGELNTSKVTYMNGMFRSSRVSNVREVNNFDTSKVRNMHAMFMNLTSVSHLELTNFDTSQVTDMSYMFRGGTYAPDTSSLRTVDLSSFDTSNVTNMAGMFYTTGIVELDLSNFDTSKVTNMYNMFGGHFENRIRKLDISSFGTSNVTNMSNMFYRSQVQDLNLSNFDTSSVTDMNSMFSGSQATRLDLSSFDTSNVTNMSNMFRDSQATSIDLSSFDTSSVTNMGYMFRDSQATSLDLSSFDTRKVLNMEYMFYNSKAEELDLSSFRTDNLTDFRYIFAYADAKGIDVSNFNTSKVKDMRGVFQDSKVEDLDLRSFDTSNATDMSDMFNGVRARTINLSSFDTSSVDTMFRMFKDSRAEQLDLSKFNTSNVTNFTELFSGSYAQELYLRSFDTSKVTDMSNMFTNAKAVSINVSSFDTTYITDMSDMFSNVQAPKIDISSFDMTGVNQLDNMFKGATTREVNVRSSMEEGKVNGSLGKPTSLKVTVQYKMATNDDFSGFLNGGFRYIGEYEYIEMPYEIKGINVNSYNNMFAGTSVKGVISTNPNVTDMSGMFLGNTSEELNVRTLNTEKVTTMKEMFKDTKAKYLDLRGFTTDKVVDMSEMFGNTQVGELDLSTFNMVNVNNTGGMFKGANAKVGYSRDQISLNIINKSSNKPETLGFTIWGITTEQDSKGWTNEPITIKVNALSGNNGIDYVEMIDQPGRNYLLNSRNFNPTNANGADSPVQAGTDRIGKWITGYNRNYNNAFHISTYAHPTYEAGKGTRYSNELYPLPTYITYSLTVMSPEPVILGFYGGGGNQYKLEPNVWTRISTTVNTTNQQRPMGLTASVGENLHVPTGTKLYYKDYKIEKGTKATPWSPAPEDSSGNNEGGYEVYINGTYIFRATDTQGNTKTISHTVSNIDTTQPTAKLTKSTTGQTPQDVEIYVNAEDDLSGVDYITMPDGTKVSGNTATYIAKDNGKYEFKITDKAGNTTKYTEEVNNIDRSLVVIKTEVDNDKWTRDPVNITITSEESASEVTGIEMVNRPYLGENLLTKTGGFVGVRRHGFYYDEIIKENGKEIYEFSGMGGNSDGNIIFLGHDAYRLEKGKEYTFSFYAKASKPLKLIGSGVYISGGNYGFLRGQGISTEWERYSFVFTSNNSNAVNVHMYPAIRDVGGDFYITEWKLEEGNNLTPWTPSPKEMKLDNNSITYPVTSNGLYTFKASYENGVTSEVSVNVTNIDLEVPDIEISNNLEDWTEEDEIELEITASDDKSGVKSITLPDGRVVNGSTATYKVSENGDYEFIVMDNVGNVTTHTETVDRLMIQYGFYIYDSDNKPVEGADFELLVDGGVFKTAISDKNGYVDFGKVPPTWSYTIRQVSSPDGSVLPGDIEVEDPTDPVEVVNYPRGTVMPSTGTIGALFGVTVIIVLSISIFVTIRKKNKLNR